MDTERCRISMTGWSGSPEEYGALIALGAEASAVGDVFEAAESYNGIPLVWFFWAPALIPRPQTFTVRI